jgi:SagB-type dehydrogenase family enzyme
MSEKDSKNSKKKRALEEGLMKKGIGDQFQMETKYFRGKLSGGPLLWNEKPETYKQYTSVPKIKLDPPDGAEDLSLWDSIQKRRSIRSFSQVPMKKKQISRLLWATQGVTKVDMGFEFRASPSAGALYPVETYLIINNIEDVPAGIYHYNVKNHELEQIRLGDFRLEIARAALDQDMAYSAGVVFAWTALFERAKWKYKQRAYRYVYLDAGHIAQSLALAAVSLRLGSCQIAALYDDEVNELLKIDGEKESILYLSVVGQYL